MQAGDSPLPIPSSPPSDNAGEPADLAPIVIVGGGFGGLYTALALASRSGHPPVLLIEPNDRFLFLPLLYELLSGELRAWEIAPPYDNLLAGAGVGWLKDRVLSIHTDTRLVRTEGGHQLPYSALVLATGATENTAVVPGASRHALTFRSLADAARLGEVLRDLAQRERPLQRLAIVGAGPTGVELACKVADMLQGACIVELIEQGEQVLPLSRAFNREQALSALRRRDVRLRLKTRVETVESDRLTLLLPAAGDGMAVTSEELPVRAVIWTAGLRFQPPHLFPPPPAEPSGRLRCHPDLRLEGHAEVFVVGDLAALTGSSPDLASPPPASAQVAFQQAPVAARNVRHALAGEPLEPFVWQDLGEMLSLGQGEATLTGAGLTLAGAPAFALRRLAYLTRLPGLSQQLRVAAGWLADP
ncbi:MAG: FAD-dependent oxidoreductase [Cyanobacteriota bacterium]|nr:FAD-dependent oxidoreductase [Cyanobacteriota bacterium]